MGIVSLAVDADQVEAKSDRARDPAGRAGAGGNTLDQAHAELLAAAGGADFRRLARAGIHRFRRARKARKASTRSCRSARRRSRPRRTPERAPMRAPGERCTRCRTSSSATRGSTATACSRSSASRRQTFRQYAERARRLASALHAGGLRSQDRVAILAMNCPEYLEVYGVGEVAPFIVAPVNFRLAPPEILYVLRDAAPAVLFFEKQYEATIAAAARPAAGDPSLHLHRRRCAGLGRRLRGGPRAGFAGRAGARSAARAHSRRHVHERHDGPAEGRDADACGLSCADRGLGARARRRCRRPHPAVDAVLPRRRAIAGRRRDVRRRHDGDPAFVRCRRRSSRRSSRSASRRCISRRRSCSRCSTCRDRSSTTSRR